MGRIGDVLMGLAIAGVPVLLLSGAICGIVALVRASRSRREVLRLRQLLADLQTRLARLETGGIGVETPAQESLIPDRQPEAVEPQAEPAPTPAPSAPEPAAPTPASAPVLWGGLEQRIGQRWTVWVGVLALFLGVAFFVKHAFEQRWISPTLRVSLGVLLGMALLAGGDRFLRRAMRALGLGLIGGGLAILYVSIFAAFAIYDRLLTQPVAFAAMCAVTVGGMALAVLHNALSAAFLAVLGGLLTPVLLSTGVDARDALFTYLLILDLGVLGVACFRRWRALDVLAFTGTAILYGAWHAEFYRKAAFEPALAWLAAFYAVFLVLPFLYHLRWREVTPVERFVLALANGTWFIAFAYRLMWPDMRHALGFVAAAAAAAYAALAAVQRRRNAADTRGIFGFVALAVAFLALAAPLHFGLHGTALAWTIEAPVLIYLGYRFAYRPLRTAGAVVLGLALGQVLARGWPEHDQVFVLVLNRRFAGAMSAAVFGWACAWVHQRRLAEATWLDRVLKVLAAVLSGLLALLVLHREVWQWCYLDHLFHQARWAVTLVWAVGGLAFVAAGLRLRSRPTWWTALVPLAAGLALGLAQYQYSAPDGQSLFANARFAAALVAVAAAVASGWLLARSAAATRAAPTLLTVGLVGLLAVLSVEVTEHCRAAASLTWDARGWAARMALSMTWAAYASGLLLVGFARRLRPLRLAALALFAVTALKAVFLDLAGVREGYRIILFLALGVLMIGASYLYHRAERLLEGRAEDDR